jgi:MoxR-like ATPase
VLTKIKIKRRKEMNNFEMDLRLYNTKHEQKHIRTQKLIGLYNAAVDEHGQGVVSEFLKVTYVSNMYNALKYSSMIKRVAREMKEKEEQPMQTIVKEEKEIVTYEPKQPAASEMTIGLLERTLATVIAEKYVPEIAGKVIEDVKNTIEKEYGKVVRKIEFHYEGKKLDQVTHDEFETVTNFVIANEPLFLVGPAGSGKNVICRQVADLLGLEFYFTNAVTQEFKLTGFIDAMGKYHETEFYKAFKNGGLFMLDEMDGSIPETLIILNAAIANRYFDFPNGRIDAHENFRVIGAGNTYGHGASMQYAGRNQLDGATLNRFAIVEIGYSEAIENSMTQDVELIEFVRDFRKAIEKAGINHIVGYRELSRMNKMLHSNLGVKKVIKTCLTKNLEDEDLRVIKNSMNKTYNKYYKEI